MRPFPVSIRQDFIRPPLAVLDREGDDWPSAGTRNGVHPDGHDWPPDPTATHQIAATPIAGVADVAVGIGVFDAEIAGFNGAAAGVMNGGIRLLQRAQPRAMELPSTMIAAREVRRVSVAAMRLGEGISP